MLSVVLEWLTEWFYTGAIIANRKPTRSKEDANPPNTPGSLSSHALQGTQAVGIHDALNAQKVAMHYGAISNTVHHNKVINVRESFTAKHKSKINRSNMTSFPILNVLEPKILQYNCLEGHCVWENDCFLSRNEVAIFLVANGPEFLVALASVSVQASQT